MHAFDKAKASILDTVKAHLDNEESRIQWVAREGEGVDVAAARVIIDLKSTRGNYIALPSGGYKVVTQTVEMVDSLYRVLLQELGDG